MPEHDEGEELAEVIDLADYRLAKFKSQLNFDADYREVFSNSWPSSWPERAVRATYLTQEDLERLLYHHGETVPVEGD